MATYNVALELELAFLHQSLHEEKQERLMGEKTFRATTYDLEQVKMELEQLKQTQSTSEFQIVCIKE